MKHSIVSILLITTTALTTSLVASGKELYGKPTVTVAQRLTATRNAQVRVSVPRIPKFKVLRANPHRLSHFITNDDDDGIEDDSIISSYRRRDLNKIEHEDNISDNVRWRLFLARQLALLKHKEIWG